MLMFLNMNKKKNTKIIRTTSANAHAHAVRQAQTKKSNL